MPLCAYCLGFKVKIVSKYMKSSLMYCHHSKSQIQSVFCLQGACCNRAMYFAIMMSNMLPNTIWTPKVLFYLIHYGLIQDLIRLANCYNRQIYYKINVDVVGNLRDEIVWICPIILWCVSIIDLNISNLTNDVSAESNALCPTCTVDQYLNNKKHARIIYREMYIF